MAERVLVVEDEIILQETLAYNLKRQGYEVETASDGNEAIRVARRSLPDLILLDIMLPILDGFEVCRTLRQEMIVPIIFLSARDNEIDRVIGLEIGGDDFIAKPFSMRELVARVKARLRMTRMIQEKASAEAGSAQSLAADEDLVFGNLRINARRREVLLDGHPLWLRPKEFGLLLFFTQNHGRIITREQILQQVWSFDPVVDSRTVDVHVRWLREKIEKDPSNPTRLVTVRGAGYRFEG